MKLYLLTKITDIFNLVATSEIQKHASPLGVHNILDKISSFKTFPMYYITEIMAEM